MQTGHWTDWDLVRVIRNNDHMRAAFAADPTNIESHHLETMRPAGVS